MAKEIKVITTVGELVEVMNNAKNAEKRGGQKVWVYGTSDVHTNKYPYDANGNTLPRRYTNLHPELALQGEWKKAWHIELNFGTDYAKRMAKALGIESYEPKKDDNREHIVPAILMRYKSTNNTCFIAMPNARQSDGVLRDGQPATESDLQYLAPYKQKKNDNRVIEYLTIGVKNITRISIGNVQYMVEITDSGYYPEPEETQEMAMAMAY